MLIGAGGTSDSASIQLATKRGTFIPNERRCERSPDSLKAAVEIWKEKYPNIRARSLTAVYNCVGLVFGSRRTWIDPAHLNLILIEDDYRSIEEYEVEIGDVVIYRNGSAYTHVGIIVNKNPNFKNASFEITVMSQWGADGEYIHLINEVPDNFGKSKEFWTDRRRVQCLTKLCKK